MNSKKIFEKLFFFSKKFQSIFNRFSVNFYPKISNSQFQEMAHYPLLMQLNEQLMEISRQLNSVETTNALQLKVIMHLLNRVSKVIINFFLHKKIKLSIFPASNYMGPVDLPIFPEFSIFLFRLLLAFHSTVIVHFLS